ncbi:hypothetical protein [Legionella worsleiensis]|uniref:Uncharacterized protein n=1 Tax=Legionella worsleiensis TaxID=45076 RepID=A0A0W1AKN2_9GAMM|nr:hypothetical protein [Legionella worsleiensis]KTD81919.1 hypothetical protein Lwor_0222 [Legionella worsleiensis]STY31249.1 Uncharacterised protein [Legionella worsleiensis]
MRIESSSLNLKSQNSAYSRYERTEELRIENRQSDASGQKNTTVTLSNKQVKEQSFLATYEELSQQTKPSALREEGERLDNLLNQNNAVPISTPEELDSTDPLELSLQDKMKLRLIYELLQRVYKDPELRKAIGLDDTNQDNKPNLTNSAPSTPAPAAPPAPDGVEINYSVREVFYQSETAQFSAAGEVKTADGKTINITIDLKMSREVLETRDFSARLSRATKDPLVINFDGTAAELSNKRFSFDLTADGVKELIPQLTGNRALLALDKNQDGVINDGSELFGARTGNGFVELAQYDQDKNGWIDENDTVFNDLKLWKNAGTDQQQLIGLKEAGIGALYTSSAKTSYQVQDVNDVKEKLGVIQATGLFLNEDGGAGTIQHVDLSI